MTIETHVIEAEGVLERRITVARNYHRWRLDRFIAEKIRRMTRSHAHRIIRGGGVRVEPPRKIKPGTLLRTDDTVIIRQSLEPEDDLSDQVTLLAQTPTFIALNKPAGMLVHRTARAGLYTLDRHARRQGYYDPRVVHRLDRETSGVIIMALGHAASLRWSQRFHDNDIHKTYLAAVLDPQHLHTPGLSGRSDLPLGHDTQSPLPDLVITHGDWPATTRWRCLARHQDLALLAVEIEGGRQHQIRAHLSLHGTPLVGDKLYTHGATFYLAFLAGEADLSALRAPRHALHAWSLRFTEEGHDHHITAPPPPLFRELIPEPWLSAD